MAEDELIWAMCCAYDEATDEEGIDVAMSRVLAVVRSHDAARVPADAEMDGLVAWLSSRQTCTGFASPEPHVLETVYAPCEKSQSAADAITALRARVAELEAAKWAEKHVDTMNDFVLLGMDRDEWEARAKALEARCIQMHRRAQKAEGALASANERLAAAEENGGKSPRNVVTYFRKWREALGRVAELEAGLAPFACSCTGRCEHMGWMPADNCPCSYRRARALFDAQEGRADG